MQYLNKSAENDPVQSQPEVSFEKHFLLRDILQIKEISVRVSLALNSLVFSVSLLTVHEREGGVLRDVNLRIQTQWLDCVYITHRDPITMCPRLPLDQDTLIGKHSDQKRVYTCLFNVHVDNIQIQVAC